MELDGQDPSYGRTRCRWMDKRELDRHKGAGWTRGIWTDKMQMEWIRGSWIDKRQLDRQEGYGRTRRRRDKMELGRQVGGG